MTSAGYAFDIVSASDAYIYVTVSNGTSVNIFEIKYDFSSIDHKYNITDECKKRVGDNFEITTMNVVKNQIFLCIRESGNSKPGMYHIKVNGEILEWQTVKNVGNGVDDVCVVVTDDDYRFCFIMDGSRKYVRYDKDGNYIKPTN